MVESLQKKYEKRTIFPSGKQQYFLSEAVRNLDLSWPSFADKIGVHKRTLNDWKREGYSMPFNVVEKISKLAKVQVPKGIKVKEPFWYAHKGAKKGGKMGARACFKKYGSYGGDPGYRKKKWYEWWEREGKYKSNIISAVKPIKKPDFSEELAEFVGIVLGDGSISNTQVSFTFHAKDDREYSDFVVGLSKKLFDVYVGNYHDKKANVIRLYISRVRLVKFCTEKLGLKKGHKIRQQVNIPDWIKDNKKYAIACVRGLIDTDGCIFSHRYQVKGKTYEYKKLTFVSALQPLLDSVFNIIQHNGLNPRLAEKGQQGLVDLRLDSIVDMRKYFEVFGSHNPKHLKRYGK